MRPHIISMNAQHSEKIGILRKNGLFQQRSTHGRRRLLTAAVMKLWPSCDTSVPRGPRGKHEGAAMNKADEEAIRQIELGFNEAWGGPRCPRHGRIDGRRAHFVTVNGAWTKTRAKYLELMTRLHGTSGPFRSSTRETPVMDIDLSGAEAIAITSCPLFGDIDEPPSRYDVAGGRGKTRAMRPSRRH